MIASSAPQILAVAGAIIASSSPSAVSWLYFANRLIELPLGIVGVAMGTVLVPELTRALRGDDQSGAIYAQSRGLELAVGLALPATLGLIALSGPIVQLLFEHGAFTPADSAATARALIWLSLGLPAHVMVKALSPIFFARHDTLTPLWATLQGFAVTIILAFVLGRWFGTDGIAAGIAIGAWSSALSLIRRTVATIGLAIDPASRRRLPRMGAAALAMGGLLWWMSGLILSPASSYHGLVQVALVLAMVAGGMAVYGLLLTLFGAIKWNDAIRQTGTARLRD